MRRFKVILRPSTGSSTFVRPSTGNLVDAYREVTVEAATEAEAVEIANVRSAQMSGAAKAAIDPEAVLPIWYAVVKDRDVLELNRRAEYHARIGLALLRGELEAGDVVPDVGDPRVYVVSEVAELEPELEGVPQPGPGASA